MPTYVNRFGRKPTRGLRPWLLLPKVVCVGLYVGGLAAALAVWITTDLPALDAADPKRLWTINLLGQLFLRLIVPALLGALVLGLALFLQHPRAFIHMRWLQVKLIAVPVVVISGHLFMRDRLLALRNAAIEHRPHPAAETQFFLGLILLLAASTAILLLARLKPRLRQNYARALTVDR